MVVFPESAYARWRAVAVQSSFLREATNELPGEHLLQLVWQHQRLRSDQLLTTDARPVRVLHPGFWNRGRGPDFRGSVLRLGDAPAVAGDVEIDQHVTDWQGHHHQGNPAYAGVILHVVWHPPSRAPTGLPVLPLLDRLDATMEELITWVDLDPGLPENVLGRCASGLRALPASAIEDWLRQASLFRFQRKAVEFAARARQVGWERSLWEGLCGALGYQNNVWPMRRLAEQSHLLAQACADRDLVHLQALLLGTSSLLPHETRSSRNPPHPYLRALWDHWWRERHAWSDSILPSTLWRLGGLRPANHPQRRVALTAHWLLQPDLLQQLEHWLTQPCPDRQLVSSLLELLQPRAEPFWSRHWTLTSAPIGGSPQPLLGLTRLHDIAINVLLPWFWIRAETGSRRGLKDQTVARYCAWPAAQDNAVLRLARQRLFAGEPGRLRWTAALQQGLLQVIRDFCGHSNALCDNCVLPERLKEIGGALPQQKQESRAWKPGSSEQ